MRIFKKVHGFEVELQLELLEDLKKFSIYQVYRIDKGKSIPIYKTTYTDSEIKAIVCNGYKVIEEVFK